MKSILLLLLPIFSIAAYAQVTVESVVAEIARKYNASPQTDATTASSTAIPNGKEITFHNVMRVKKGLGQAQLAAFRAGLVEEVVKPACAANVETFKFAKTLVYHFVYDNTYGERLAVLTVSEPVCAGRQAP